MWPFLGLGVGLVGLGCFRGSVGLSAVVILAACVPCPPAKGKGRPKYKKSSFRPCLRPSVFCCVSIHRETKRKTALLLGRFFLGCGCVWFLLFGTESVKMEHCKRGGLFAKYPYFLCCVVCLHLAGGGACNIVQICSVCGLCAGLAPKYSNFVCHGSRVFVVSPYNCTKMDL